MTAQLKNIGFTLLCSALGLSLFYSIYQTPGAPRTPASANIRVQLSAMDPAEMQQQIRRKIKVLPTKEGEKTISFNGFSSDICNNYAGIEMHFAADGVSVAGEPTTMMISAPCQASTTNKAEMAALKFPVGKILNEKPRNRAFTYENYNATLTFANMADEWPKTWVLTRVDFKTADGADVKSATMRNPASAPEERPIILQF